MVDWCRASLLTVSNSSSIARDRPMIPRRSISSVARDGGVARTPLALARSISRASVARRLSVSIGLVRKSVAPRFIASTAVSTVPKPVTTTAGSPGCCSRMASRTAAPSMSGSFRSRMSACSFSRRAAARAARPFDAWRTA